jgi:hypothetical protein
VDQITAKAGECEREGVRVLAPVRLVQPDAVPLDARTVQQFVDRQSDPIRCPITPAGSATDARDLSVRVRDEAARSPNAAESFDLDAFNVDDYYGAVHDKAASETISKVLYPNAEFRVTSQPAR